jgi:drug/metabolite transporter (DMT)-like permease
MMVEDAVKYTSRSRAIIFINLMTFGATFTNIAFKLANANGVSAVDYQIFRGFFICLFVIPFLLAFKKHPVKDVPEGRYPLVFLRGFLGTINFIFYMWAMTLLPMYLAVILNNLSPFLGQCSGHGCEWGQVLYAGVFGYGDMFRMCDWDYFGEA